MKGIAAIIFFSLIGLSSVIAQRLYLHDMFNGNYRSYDAGDEIEIMLLDSANYTKGEITGMTATGIYLSTDQQHLIQLNQIATVVTKRRGVFVRVVSGIAGAGILVVGTIYTIGGLISIAEEPALGAGVAIIGGIMATGGYLLIDKVARPKNVHKALNVDNINYRLFIE